MPFRATAYQKRLEEAGFDPKMALAQAAAMEEFVVSELVTRDYLDARLSEVRSELKGEISALRAELKPDITTLRGDFRAEIAAVETRLIRWVVGSVGGAALAVILTLVRVMRQRTRVHHPQREPTHVAYGRLAARASRH
jgi:hypothetical protein